MSSCPCPHLLSSCRGYTGLAGGTWRCWGAPGLSACPVLPNWTGDLERSLLNFRHGLFHLGEGPARCAVSNVTTRSPGLGSERSERGIASSSPACRVACAPSRCLIPRARGRDGCNGATSIRVLMMRLQKSRKREGFILLGSHAG